jgi:filamentous hemagglutinin family protein
MNWNLGFFGLSATLSSLFIGIPSLGVAQTSPIIPAPDRTGTQINQTGNRFEIQGGSLSRDGQNLFHSFTKFGLQNGQIADFLSNPNVRNIFGRITGGDASYINGLIQITGGSSNLYLMNPAGIFFGPNASLNVPASFSVTTANQIGFNNGWFDSQGFNNYSTLIGTPSAFSFSSAQPAAIINEGHLQLSPGNAITFLAGTVINTGEISAPGGQITIASVPGHNTVQIRQVGHLLNLEITPNLDPKPTHLSTTISPLSLPQLLTGSNAGNATTLMVNQKGEVILTGSGITIPNEAGITVTSGTLNVFDPNFLSQAGSQSINILGNKIAVLDASINANGRNSGGQILIGGEYQGSGLVPNALRTFVSSDSVISANALEQGNGGRVIVWADETNQFYGNITAQGGAISGNGGFVEISGKENLIFRGSVDVSAANGLLGTILFDPDDITVAPERPPGEEPPLPDGENPPDPEPPLPDEEPPLPDQEPPLPDGENPPDQEPPLPDGENPPDQEPPLPDEEPPLPDGENPPDQEPPLPDEEPPLPGEEAPDPQNPPDDGVFNPPNNSNLTITANDFNNLNGNVVLQADNDINIIEAINTRSSIELKAGRNININRSIDTALGNGNIILRANHDGANLENRQPGAANVNQLPDTSLNAGSGNILIELGSLAEAGTLNLKNIQSTGTIALNAGAGNINTVGGTIDANSVFQNGGNVLMNARGNIFTGTINTASIRGTSGNILIDAGGILNTSQGNLITSSPDGIGGNIRLQAGRDIIANNLIAQGILQGGNITLESDSSILIQGNLESFSLQGIGGNISLFSRQNINTGNIRTSGNTRSGDVILTADIGTVKHGLIDTLSSSGQRGRIVINQGDTNPLDDQEKPELDREEFAPEKADQIDIEGDDGVLEIEDQEDALSDESNTQDGDVEDEQESEFEIESDIFDMGEVNAPINNLTEQVIEKEKNRTSEFAEYLGTSFSNSVSTATNFREALVEIEQKTQNRSAVVYVTSLPSELELVVFLPDGKPIRRTVPNVQREQLFKVIEEFRRRLTGRVERNTTSYLQPAQQLYQWLIAPIEADLNTAKIDTLLLSMDAGLRSLPIAALHDGQQFLIEKYSLSLIPSISLVDVRYQSLENAHVLAMGASQFTNLNPLPAVPVELSIITQQWQGSAFMNQEFTVENLRQQRQKYPYQVIHLATHAEFLPGTASNSYIQLWNEKLQLDQLRTLGWDQPPVELLVLSACRTAVGDTQAELGFAGLAVQAGVKSALASLWYVSDEGTLALMSEFYTQLSSAKIKAEALRQAQIAMIRGTVQIESGQLRGSASRGSFPLPAELAEIGEKANLSHPYYWAGFTLIGSPW